MKNFDIGAFLKGERLKQGQSLQDIEKKTHISIDDLEKIESNQVFLIEKDQQLTYLIHYSSILNVNILPLLRQSVHPDIFLKTDFQNTSEEKDMPSSVDSTSKVVEKNITSEMYHTSKEEVTFTSTTTDSEYKRTRDAYEEDGLSFFETYRPVIVLMSSIILLAVLGLIIYFLIFNKPTASSNSETSASTTTAVSSSTVQTPTETLSVIGSGDTLDVTISNATAPVKIEIDYSGNQESWVFVSNNDSGDTGGVTLTSEYNTYTTSLASDATDSLITLGLSEGITVKINGQVLDMSALDSTDLSYISLNIQ